MGKQKRGKKYRAIIRRAEKAYNEKRFGPALGLCKDILAINAGDTQALVLGGLSAFESGDTACAENYIGRAIVSDPRRGDLFFHLGRVHLIQGRADDALRDFNTALQLGEESAGLFYHCGLLLQHMGSLDEALNWYGKALLSDPSHREALNNSGNICFSQRKFELAKGYFSRALEVDPKYLEALNNLAVLSQELGDFDSAREYYLKGLSIAPDFPELNVNLGNLFKLKGDLEQAAVHFERALQASPDLHEVRMQLVLALQAQCDWKGLEKNAAILLKASEKCLAKGEKSPETPFYCLGRYSGSSHMLAVARSWSMAARERAAGAEQRVKAVKPMSSSRGLIRVGYFSHTFRNHPNAYLVAGMIEKHDRAGFEIRGYSYGPDDGSSYRRRMEMGFDVFTDLEGLDFAEMAGKIRGDGVDILVDLAGFTGNGLMEVCALRPAPIQIRYLGFPGSTGADFFDYIITDRLMIPPGSEENFSEKLILLPGCYQVNDNTRKVPGGKIARREAGLPETSFIFACFCGSYKIEPVMFECWMRILHRVPGSVLWLLKGNEASVRNLKREAEMLGIRSSRLVFAEKLPREEHMERLHLADLALDTRLVTGHITTTDALWSGVPVITLKGNHFISRAPSSILTAAGLSGLICESLSEYEERAVKSALSGETLKGLKEKLEINRFTCDLFDTDKKVRLIEFAYKKVYERYARGLMPDHIEFC